jgi:nucleotide-binding universal stress UspA family protein
MDIATILVATDFSPAADAAVASAMMLAQGLHADVHLLHVVDDSAAARFWSKDVLTPTAADLQATLVRAAWERLRNCAGPLSVAGIAITSDVQVGPVAATITDVARYRGTSLIVTGTRGQTGLPHLVLGSVAERLVRTAPCPVLAVHAGRPALRRIVAATDFGEAADEALHYATSLAVAFGASLHVVHVVEDPWPMGTETYVRSAAEIRGLLEHDAQILLAERLGSIGGDATSEVAFGTPARAIADIAADRDADLIAMGTHGRGPIAHVLMGSVADRVMRIAGCPVLTVRGPSVAAEPVAARRDTTNRAER